LLAMGELDRARNTLRLIVAPTPGEAQRLQQLLAIPGHGADASVNGPKSL
jgi:hypothetical protein